jgi:hypothetical protein
MSSRAQAIRASIAEPLGEEFILTKEETQAFKARYHNSSFESLKILIGRELLLWARDRYQIKARLMQGKSSLLTSSSSRTRAYSLANAYRPYHGHCCGDCFLATV